MQPFFDPDRGVEKHGHKLPHWQQDDTWVSVTWRQADSLPQSKLTEWKEERDTWLALHAKPWDAQTESAYHERFTEKMEEWLGAGHGSCLLRTPENAKIVADALHHFDGERYQLASYVVMPNHVHVIFSPSSEIKLEDILHSWKRHSSNLINRRERRSGTLWQAGYWDRLIRSQEHFEWCLRYIANNPSQLLPHQFLLWP
jgi:REP element-mobilizing transposase RayT